MHLTNYSVNKHNENFERDETVDKGSKRSIGWFTEFLRTNDYDVAKFWGDVSVSCFYFIASLCYLLNLGLHDTMEKCDVQYNLFDNRVVQE